jgi:hypothetical protein
MAEMVSALGTSGSKGSAFSAATRLNSSRNASDSESPIVANTAAASVLVASSMRARTTAFTVMPHVFVSYNVAHTALIVES